jgi:hypothetical protein
MYQGKVTSARVSVKSSNRCQNVVWNSTTASVSFWRNTWKRISIGWVPSSILPVAQLQESPDLTRFQRGVQFVFLRLSQHEYAIELLTSKEISSRNNHAASETHLSLKRINLRCRPCHPNAWAQTLPWQVHLKDHLPGRHKQVLARASPFIFAAKGSHCMISRHSDVVCVLYGHWTLEHI